MTVSIGHSAEACTVVIGESATDAPQVLPSLGGLIALLALLGGLALLTGLALRRHRGTAAGLAVLLAAGLVVVHLPSRVDAADGCRLLRVSDVRVNSSAARAVLPGDRLELITATVANPTDLPVVVSADLRLEPATSRLASLTAELTAGTTAAGPLDGLQTTAAGLDPGEELTTTLVVALPAGDDTLQDVHAGVRLTLTAMERR